MEENIGRKVLIWEFRFKKRAEQAKEKIETICEGKKIQAQIWMYKQTRKPFDTH